MNAPTAARTDPTLILDPPPGLLRGVPMAGYLEINALSSSRLEWLAASPLYYRHMLTQPREETPALALGTALHMAALEPDLFATAYALEPDVAAIGGAKPRATKEYKEAVDAIESSGRIVLKADTMETVLGMRDSILAHPHAAALLKRTPEREVSGIWKRGERLCRARFDMLGEGVIGDIKTTRNIKDFSPWTITRLGYYRRAGWYADGARRLGRTVDHFMFIAVESSAPWDVGVFALDEDMLRIGMDECEFLIKKLERCEAEAKWPGRFPDVQQAMLSDAIALQLASGESEDE